VLVFVERGKQENPKTNTQSKARTNNKLNLHVTRPELNLDFVLDDLYWKMDKLENFFR